MRRVIGAAVLLLVAAGCGQQTGTSAGSDPSASASTSASPSASPSDAAAGSAWLLRFDSYVGEDGEGRKASYVSVVPATGRATKVVMPTVEPMQVTGRGVTLLVDAGHHWALPDNRPGSKAQRSKGVVRLYDLTADGSARSVSVRRIAGVAGLRADWVSFDPTTPGVLRVVSGQQVWKVDLSTRQATQESRLPTRAGWIYGGGFDANTGQPYIEDTGSFDTDPPGNGDDATAAITRSGGTVVDPQVDQPYGATPEPCEVSAGYVAQGGATWAFCVQGAQLQTKVLDAGATTWRDVGPATAAVVPGDADPVFALPPA